LQRNWKSFDGKLRNSVCGDRSIELKHFVSENLTGLLEPNDDETYHQLTSRNAQVTLVTPVNVSKAMKRENHHRSLCGPLNGYDVLPVRCQSVGKVSDLLQRGFHFA
jgi:hypothetical protein